MMKKLDQGWLAFPTKLTCIKQKLNLEPLAGLVFPCVCDFAVVFVYQPIAEVISAIKPLKGRSKLRFCESVRDSAKAFKPV